MKNFNDDSWYKNNNWGRWGKDDEVGMLNEATPAHTLSGIAQIKQGKIYDLETLRFKGMPTWPGHAGFDILVYASPSGRKNMEGSDYPPFVNWMSPGGWLAGSANEKFKTAANTDIMITPLHAGTHIDALSHITAGEDGHWYNGFCEKEHLTNFGPLKCDGASIPPIILRGTLLDIPGSQGKPHLDMNYSITMKDVEQCLAWQGVEINEGDAVLIRTGERWPQMDLCGGAGVSLEAARYLIEEKKAFIMGTDTVSFESFPDGKTSYEGHVHPVHQYMLVEQGVHIIELLQLDELAADKAYNFCFICISNKIKGATGSFIRPVAVV